MDPKWNSKPEDQHRRATPDSQFWNTCSKREMKECINKMDSQRFGRNKIKSQLHVSVHSSNDKYYHGEVIALFMKRFKVQITQTFQLTIS